MPHGQDRALTRQWQRHDALEGRLARSGRSVQHFAAFRGGDGLLASLTGVAGPSSVQQRDV